MTNTGQAEKGETHGRNDRERVGVSRESIKGKASISWSSNRRFRLLKNSRGLSPGYYNIVGRQ